MQERLRSWLMAPTTWALGAIVALAAALRFWGLGRQGLWWDEGYSVNWSRLGYGQVLDILRNRDFHPPLYYFGLHLWMQLFGTSDAAVRSLSAFAGLGAVLAIYALGRDLHSRRAGLVAAALLAVSSFAVYYSQEARSYSVLLLASILSVHGYWLCFHGPRQGTWPTAAYWLAATAAMLYVHNAALYVAAAQVLHRAGVLALQSDRKPIPRSAALFGGLAVLYVPWFLVLLGQAGRLESGFWMRPLFQAGVSPDFTVGGTLGLFAGGVGAAVVLWVLVLNGLLATKLGGLNAGRTPNADEYGPYPAAATTLLLAWMACSLLLPYLQSLVSEPIFVSRITIPALAPFLLLAAIGAARMAAPAAAVVAAVVVIGLAVPGLVDLERTSFKEEWRQAAADVAAQAQAGATVLVVPGNPYSPWAEYAPATVATAYGSESVPPDNATAAARDVWVVARQSPACGSGGALLDGLARTHRLAGCQALVPDGLADFPLASNALYVHHYVAN